MEKKKLKSLKAARRPFFKPNDLITVKDFGAGSQEFSKAERKLSQIAKKAGMPWHQSKLISKIVDFFHIKTALELGTSVGLGSTAMTYLNLNLKLDTVEACPKTAACAKQNFNALGIKNISIYNSHFQSFLEQLDRNKTYDLVYLDGHHQKESTLNYFSLIKKHLHQDSIVILDDIYWSKDMQQAWHSICEDKDVKLSLDLYFWGIVFFKSELTKQHFKIRCFL
jgi:predicted O-methyltransferase YrrM